MAKIAVDAVCSVCEWERRDVHFDHIKIESRVYLNFIIQKYIYKNIQF